MFGRGSIRIRNRDTRTASLAYLQAFTVSFHPEISYRILQLQRLRSRHIRQLIYIALHTTTASLPNENAGDSPPSPGLSKNTLLVPPAAVVAARRLLVSFASTNSPQVVARALPRYPDHHESNILLAEDVGDSAIAVESMSLSGSKSCWNILAEGFIHRTRQMLPTPKGKGKQCTERADHKPVSMAENPNVVGDDAWPVLEWLLLLFERDELLTEAFGSRE